MAHCLASAASRGHEAALRRLFDYDLSRVRQRVVDKRLIPPAVVAAAELEYRKYMALSLFHDDEHAMFSVEVDEVWHAHLLFTRDYARFCAEVFGRFVHHEPLGAEASADASEADAAAAPVEDPDWVRFARDYTRLFGEVHFLWGTTRMRERAAERAAAPA